MATSTDYQTPLPFLELHSAYMHMGTIMLLSTIWATWDRGRPAILVDDDCVRLFILQPIIPKLCDEDVNDWTLKLAQFSRAILSQ